MMQEYNMEELVPIVADLARRYTSNESTSLSYEKAQQLMEAVIYCIQEVFQASDEVLATEEKLSARQAYERGYSCVERKVKEALHSYHEILPKFTHFGNSTLYDTFIRGLPEFFKWYDARFNPQDTLLTLDYPVLRDLCAYSGIDRISRYIDCIRMEQLFLTSFPEAYILRILRRYDSEYRTMIDNICEIVLMALTAHVLAEKPLSEEKFTPEEYERIGRALETEKQEAICEKLKRIVNYLVRDTVKDSVDLWEYLSPAVDNVLVRLEQAAALNLWTDTCLGGVYDG